MPKQIWILTLCGAVLAQVPTPPQVFIANNGQTSFTLSSIPTGNSLVWRNGIPLYSPADYTITAGVVTLPSPAAQGDMIQVQSPSAFVLSDEVNKIFTAKARDVNQDGHPGSFTAGRLTGSGPYTQHYDFTPPSQGGNVELSFLDNATGTEKASISYNGLFGTATLNGFTNPWSTANYCTSNPIDDYVSNGPIIFCSGYTALTQVLYTLYTKAAGTTTGTAALTLSWLDRMTGQTNTFTSPPINLQTVNASVTSAVTINSSANISISVTVTGNSNRSAVFHAEAKAIY
jgi:hypothetical protein